jgi:hypothetical protein
MRGLLPLVLALCVSGCAGCHGNKVSGTTDGSEDIIDELEALVDIEIDDTSELDGDHEADVETEASIDLLPDFPLETPPSECDIVEQTGCPDDMWCSWALHETTCEHYWICIERSSGTLSVGDTCMPGSEPRCPPGTECGPIGSSLEGRICLEWCHSDDDCSLPGSRCEDTPALYPYRGPCVGYELTWPCMMCSRG